jgi:hypothetical protein
MQDVRLVAVLMLTMLVAGCAVDAQPASRSSSRPSQAAASESGGATTNAAG